MILTPATVAQGKHIVLPTGRMLQVGALVYRVSGETLQVLLITSRGTGRWIVPKGWPMPGKTLAQAALREAYEEAGVRGAVQSVPLGRYNYEKHDVPRSENGHFSVDVFAVLYSHQEKKWPERGQRIFEWIAPQEAASRVDEAELKTILEKFDPRSLRAPSP